MAPLFPHPSIDDEDDLDANERRIDAAALRIIASWVARHDGEQPPGGGTIDRGFVVVGPRHAPDDATQKA